MCAPLKMDLNGCTVNVIFEMCSLTHCATVTQTVLYKNQFSCCLYAAALYDFEPSIFFETINLEM